MEASIPSSLNQPLSMPTWSIAINGRLSMPVAEIRNLLVFSDDDDVLDEQLASADAIAITIATMTMDRALLFIFVLQCWHFYRVY